MKEEVRFGTEDHPQANGRTPAASDVAYTLRFPLEDGRELVVEFGQLGFDVLTNHLIDMLANAPSHSDGSTNA